MYNDLIFRKFRNFNEIVKLEDAKMGNQITGELKIIDVPAEFLIENLKERLKEFDIIKPPSWSNFVKTGIHKEKPPIQDDWWYIRAASILRRVYIKGPIGVQRLRNYYGGLRRRGSRPPKKVNGSGKIVRKILQQLEAAGLVIKVRKGRKVNSKGKKLLTDIVKEFKNKVTEEDTS